MTTLEPQTSHSPRPEPRTPPYELPSALANLQLRLTSLGRQCDLGRQSVENLQTDLHAQATVIEQRGVEIATLCSRLVTITATMASLQTIVAEQGHTIHNLEERLEEYRLAVPTYPAEDWDEHAYAEESPGDERRGGSLEGVYENADWAILDAQRGQDGQNASAIRHEGLSADPLDGSDQPRLVIPYERPGVKGSLTNLVRRGTPELQQAGDTLPGFC